MTETVSKYSIYCNTEATFVEGWGVAPPTVCYNNNTHSVDTNQITTLETVTNINASELQIINKYKIFCVTENTFVEGWGDTEPTTCYNNTSHTVNLNSIQLVESVSRSEVRIKEDSAIVSRNVKIVPIVFDNVASNTSQTQSFTFQYVTSMYSYMFMTDDFNKGDSITIAVNPNTPLGLITSDITSGDMVISPPAPLFAFGQNGFNVTVSDGTNTSDLGEIISMDSMSQTITVEQAADNNFSSVNTVLYMTYYNMRNLIIGPPQCYRFGDDVIGGAAVPVGTTVTFTYTNNAVSSNISDEPKSFVVYLTLLF